MPDLRNFVKSLESETNLMEYSRYLDVVPNQSSSLASCVAHEDKKPSMKVNEDYVYCFSCGFYARAVNLTMVAKGLDFKDALNCLCDYKGHPRFQFGNGPQEEIKVYKRQRDKEKRFHDLLKEVAWVYHEQPCVYLREKRKISKGIIDQFQIGSTNGDRYFLKNELLKKGFKLKEFAPLLLNKKNQDFFQDCAVIPIFKSGKVIGIYGRKHDNTTNFKHLYLKNDGFKGLEVEAETTLYNFDNVRRYKEVYIFESIIDCLTALSNGIENSCSIYGTQGLKEEHIKQLKASRVETVYLVMDGDEAGKKAAIKNGYKIEDAGLTVKAVLLPASKDPNEYFSEGGTQEAFLKLPQFTPLQLHIKDIEPSLKGKPFLKEIEAVLKRIATLDPLIWKDELKEVKDHFHSKPSISDLKEKTKQIASSNGKICEITSLVPVPINQEVHKISTIFKDFSFGNLLIPENWKITENEILSVMVKDNEVLEIPITHAPCIIKSMSTNIDSGLEFRELVFKQNGKIKSVNVPRETICDQKRIIELSAQDFPVNSLNAKYLVQFLADFEAINRPHLLQQSVTHGFGYREDSKNNSIFYLPTKTYKTDEKIIFQGKGIGDRTFERSLKPQGSQLQWESLIKDCADFPMVMFGIYAGFAPPLMKQLGFHTSFIIDIWGDTSLGKTTLIEIIASIWGDPRYLIIPWDSTKVAAEELAGMFNGLPTFLDESQLGDPKRVKDIIYRTANSSGRAKGEKSGGLRAILKWLTILFSTGEKKLSSVTKHKGAEARTLSFWGSPFEDTGKDMSRFIKKVKRTVYENYGYGINPFLDYIYTVDEKRIKACYEESSILFDNLITDGGADSRKGDYFSLILASGLLFEEVFKFGTEPAQICKKVFNKEKEERPLDLASETKEYIVSIVNANKNFFDIIGQDEVTVDRGEVWGVINPGEYVAIFPHKLKKILSDEDYSPATVLKLWKEKEWIQTQEKKMTYPVQIKGSRSRMIKFFWKFFID